MSRTYSVTAFAFKAHTEKYYMPAILHGLHLFCELSSTSLFDLFVFFALSYLSSSYNKFIAKQNSYRLILFYDIDEG